ncbi:TRZ/ATZ family protein [Thermosulfurimonas marina]|uniref:TRZ/ATZ family protein n=1 Tax=Thermosulfurimonas marina TaxID=2047767 RepID=A0A6H1WRG8_9BACT|nr:FumA C-terminus/TtdB family hydratase beta subunit [Thermosulfurimonas marina]QJA05815.1 TRZ/ATZ family protein [Thermosulfurimonas marina]
MDKRKLVFPLQDRHLLRDLRPGELLSLSGRLLAARDATHRRIIELLERGEPLPVDLEGQAFYYVGPSPAPPGRVIGSAGPTTAYRMDAYTPRLLALGLAATIGKGPRGAEVREAIVRYGAVYLATFGGAGAYLSQKIRAARVLAFPELGPEALFELEVEDFPAIVINPPTGGDYYEEVRRRARSLR